MNRFILLFSSLLIISFKMIAQVDEEKKVHLYIVNDRSEDLVVKVRLYKDDVNVNTDHYFCWDICYTPGVNLSSGGITIAAGDSTNAFYGYYVPNGETDTSEVRYCFYLPDSPLDRVCQSYSWSQYNAKDTTIASLHFTPVASIAEEMKNNINIYPNPTTGVLNINYNLSSDAVVVINDMLGKEVLTKQLNRNFSKEQLNLSEFNEGIYFYTLISEGKTIKTEKFILTK